MMNIIFLDFDGVMDTGYYDSYLVSNNLPECDENGRPIFDPLCIENLKILVDATKADVVVTSDWKYMDKYEELLEMWRERQIPGFMRDTTPNVSQHRGDEIQQWLANCGEPCNYVIIDDLGAENFNENQLDKLVLVNPYTGLDQEATQKAIAILKRQIESEF